MLKSQFGEEFMFRVVVHAMRVGLLFAVFSACGSSGGGGSGLDVTPASLTFTATQGGTLPAPLSIHVHQDPSLVYGSTLEGDSSWVHDDSFAMIDYSQPVFDQVYSVETTNLQPGTYSATLHIVIHKPAKQPTGGPPGGPYIPGELVEEKLIPLTYVVTAALP
jgi:hypothetical protein